MVEETQTIQTVVKDYFNIVLFFFNTYINVITGGSILIGGIAAILNRKWLAIKTKKIFTPAGEAGKVDKSEHKMK